MSIDLPVTPRTRSRPELRDWKYRPASLCHNTVLWQANALMNNNKPKIVNQILTSFPRYDQENGQAGT
jgi:hypothetical protein